jgi:hypothetical protein
MISRRRFTTGVVIALTPLGATASAQEYKAQQASKVYRIGVLGLGQVTSETTGPQPQSRWVKALFDGLRERGTCTEHSS